MRLDPSTGALCHVDAGYEFGAVCQPDGNYWRLCYCGPPIGTLPGPGWEAHDENLAPG